MQGGVLELARQAAAAARAERGARGPAKGRFPYRGVMRHGDMYVAEIMDAADLRPVCLGFYETPEEAAYAYDAAARILHGDKAKPNFPVPPSPAPVARGGGGAPAAHAAVLPRRLLGHARMRTAPVGGGAHRQAPQVSYHGGAAAFSQFSYDPAAGPAFAGAGLYAAGPALAAAGGSNDAGFFGMAPMISPEPEEPIPTYAASSALSSSDKKNKAVVNASAAAGAKLVRIIEFDGEPVVEDNFPLINGGASTSSSAVPPLRFIDLNL